MLAPEDCTATKLAGVDDDLEDALEALAAAVGASKTPPAPINELKRPALPTGAVTPEGIATVLAALLPENAIVADESITAGRNLGAFMANAAPHDWLNIAAARSAGRCRSRPGRPSPRRTARSSRWKATAAACTRCRRCGRWRARTST